MSTMRASSSPTPDDGDTNEQTLSPLDFARSAGLLYVTDQQKGIRRVRAGRGFRYCDANGAPRRDPGSLARIRALAIPPAWTDVWICRSPRGHLQATGRDARGRKQYRYHARWRQVRDEAKYDRCLAFGEALGHLRGTIEADLALRGLPRDKVIAVAVRMLDEGLIRVGNEAYARENGSYGLTTLRGEHIDVRGETIRFHFRGKSGKDQAVAVTDRRAAWIIRRCQELPGQELFQYLDDHGDVRAVDSADVNEYLRRVMGFQFTSKDFRTWGGSVAALDALWNAGPSASATAAAHQVVEAVKAAACRLGNTPDVCRRCYVHPAVIAAYLDGSLADRVAEPNAAEKNDAACTGLSVAERRLLRLLRSEAMAA
jgi:DNA topoisomerase I